MQINPNDKDARLLDHIYNYFLERNKPMCFNPYDEASVLINDEKEFEEVCNSMEDSGVKDVKSGSVFEFYTKIIYLENKARRLKKVGDTKTNN